MKYMNYTNHNRTTDGEGFYISYNFADRAIYGCVTTAVVVGQMQRFYILNGNHENELIGKSFAECLDYLHDHAKELNSMSEALPPRGSSVGKALIHGIDFRARLDKLRRKA